MVSESRNSEFRAESVGSNLKNSPVSSRLCLKGQADLVSRFIYSPSNPYSSRQILASLTVEGVTFPNSKSSIMGVGTAVKCS